MLTSKSQTGFSPIIIILIITALLTLGFVWWRVWGVEQVRTAENQPTQTSASTNSVKEYFEPANINFTHDKKWTYDTSGLTEKQAGHPDQKGAKLTLPYKSASDAHQSSYIVAFTTDTIKLQAESTLKTFDKLGEVNIGGKILYILHAHYDPDQLGMNLDKIISSGCADKQCPFMLPGTQLYFEVGADKSAQAGIILDNSMLPELTNILMSIKDGKS